MKNIVCFFTALIFLTACNQPEEKPANRVVFNDFEAVAGWGSCDSMVTNERAYSGKYAIKVDPETEYTYAYRKKLSEIFGRKPRCLQLNAWIFGPDFHNGNASLVLEILRPGNNNQRVFEKKINLQKASSFKKWVKVSRELNLPETLTDSDVLNLYLWRNGANKPVFADDLEVLLLE